MRMAAAERPSRGIACSARFPILRQSPRHLLDGRHCPVTCLSYRKSKWSGCGRMRPLQRNEIATLEDCRNLENRNGIRYELVGGRPRAMVGGTPAHDRISLNILTRLDTALAGRPHGPTPRWRATPAGRTPATCGSGYPTAIIAIRTPVSIAAR